MNAEYDLESSLESVILRRIWWVGGGNISFWLSYANPIGQIVGKQEALNTAHHDYRAHARLEAKRPPFPGGIRTPHVHYNGEVYLLNEQQWRSFSQTVLNDVAARLTKASALSFDQVLKIADTIDAAIPSHAG